MDLALFGKRPSSVYHSYLVTTQLIGSNTSRRKEITQINVEQGTPFHWNEFQVTTSSLLRELQDYAKKTMSRPDLSCLFTLLFWLGQGVFVYLWGFGMSR
jgi:hypothetical protein